MKPKRTFGSFIKNVKECKDHSVLLWRRGKNVEIVSFFYKEWERTQRSFCSFIKNRKESKKRSVFFIKNGKERKNVAFLWKERCPTLLFIVLVLILLLLLLVVIFVLLIVVFVVVLVVVLNPLCTSRLNSCNDIEEFTVKIFSV